MAAQAKKEAAAPVAAAAAAAAAAAHAEQGVEAEDKADTTIQARDDVSSKLESILELLRNQGQGQDAGNQDSFSQQTQLPTQMLLMPTQLVTQVLQSLMPPPTQHTVHPHL